MGVLYTNCRNAVCESACNSRLLCWIECVLNLDETGSIITDIEPQLRAIINYFLLKTYSVQLIASIRQLLCPVASCCTLPCH